MPRQAKETRENFEAGKVDGWGAGEWGSTVRVFVDKGKLKIRYRPTPDSSPKQRTLFGHDDAELRKRAASIAVRKSEELRSGQADADQPSTEDDDDTLTVERAVLLYMRRFPGWKDDLLEATATELRKWYAGLPPNARSHACWTVISDVYGFRRLFRDERFARDRLVEEIEPGDATAYVADYVAGGKSPRTAVNDTDRLSCAFRYVKSQYRRTIGLADNPIEGRRVDREKADIDLYTTEEGRDLRLAAPQLAKEGQWQVLVAAGMATSGRRISSILALTLDDHDLEANTVTWRAEAAKGEHYGRGDETRPMTHQHRAALEWALRNHPNPEGAAHPVIWRTGGVSQQGKRDPTQPPPYSTLWRQLKRLEELAGVEQKHGRAWHAFRRWAVTTLADELSDGVAGEFVGMTIETVRAHSYKKVQDPTMEKAAGALNQLTTEQSGEGGKDS